MAFSGGDFCRCPFADSNPLFSLIELRACVAGMDEEDGLNFCATRLILRMERRRLSRLMSKCAEDENRKLNILARKVTTPEVTTFPLPRFLGRRRGGWFVEDPVRAIRSGVEHSPALGLLEMDSLIEMWRLLRLEVVDRSFIECHLRGYPTEHDEDRDHNSKVRTEIMLILRRALLQVDIRQKDGEQRLRRAFDSLAKIAERAGYDGGIGGSGSVALATIAGDAEKRWFREIGLMTLIQAPYASADIFTSVLTSSLSRRPSHIRVRRDPAFDGQCKRSAAMIRLLARDACFNTYRFLALLFDRVSSIRHSPREVTKFCSTLPRFSISHRKRILEMLEENTTTTTTTNKSGGRSGKPRKFLERLLNELGGKAKFEYVAFGRLRECGACGTSNREKYLFTCKKCQQDRMYPKRRYCDEKCQRSDWPKHREEHKKHDSSQQTGKGRKKSAKK